MFTNKHGVPTVCRIHPAIRATGTEPAADCRTARSSELCRVCRSPVGQMWAGILRKVRKLLAGFSGSKALPSDEASALSRHRPGDRCFAASESSNSLHWSVLFRWVSMGLISPEPLSFDNAPSRALRFLGARKSQRCGKTVTHSRTQRVALRSEDSAISSVTNKSFRIPIAHPILSLRRFSRISGEWLDRGG